MAVRPIIQLGNPVLRRPSRPVEQSQLEEVCELAEDMFETLMDFRQQHGYGRGIAAPQVGVNLRVVVIAREGKPLVMINPRIIRQSGEKEFFWDSCFSCPNLWYQVERHNQVTVEYRDSDWQLRMTEAQDDLAELMQHELDHLDGRQAIDLVTDTNSFCTTDEYFSRHWQQKDS